MTRRAFLGEFEQLVLLAVARLDGEGYGMSLRREIEERTGRSVSIGALYATLERLEDKALVSSRTGEPSPSRGGRARRFYRIEPAGARALHRSRDMLEAMWDGVSVGNESEGA